jgi:serine acetyltransferase
MISAALSIAARMRCAVPQRQMLFDIALSTSASVGRGFFLRNATAVMIWPDWQYPHCGT